MKRAQWTRILIEGDSRLLESLALEIEAIYDIEVLSAPEKSLVMAKVRDSVSMQPFYAGEVLVTECAVTVAGTQGFGMLMGEFPQKAYELAVVDGALRAGLPQTEDWFARMAAEEAKLAERKTAEQAMALRSKVQFDTMEETYGKR